MNSLDRIHLVTKMTLLVIVSGIVSMLHHDGASYTTMLIAGLSAAAIIGIPADLWMRRLRRKETGKS